MKSYPILACGIFAREWPFLPASVTDRLDVTFADSMLHMRPERLDALVSGWAGKGGKRLAAYGDCCPHMRELCPGCPVGRTKGVNCCEITLGRERYRELRSAGTFFFMPEWTLRWRAVFQAELGFSDPATARDFMRESMSRLAYVDTGVLPVPSEAIAEIEDFFSMPFAIERPGLGHLASALSAAIAALDSEG